MFQAPSLFNFQLTWNQTFQFIAYTSMPTPFGIPQASGYLQVGFELNITNCTAIIRRYTTNNFGNGDRIYENPLILHNATCNNPPTPPDPFDRNREPNLDCFGKMLILRICLYMHRSRISAPERAINDYSHTTIGRVISVEYPIIDENGNDTGRFTVVWTRQGWFMKPIIPGRASAGIIEESYDRTETIIYEIPLNPARSQDYETYTRSREAQQGNTSFQYEYRNRGDLITMNLPRPSITAFIGNFALTFYNAQFNNPSNVNFYTGETRPGTNFNDGDPQWVENTFAFFPYTGNNQHGYWTKCFNSPVNYNNIPPQPPVNPMTCCPQNDQLLRLILRRLGQLPATVPSNIASENAGTRTINSIAEYIAYAVIQMDAVVGQFPVEIEIEDTDLTQSGNQSQTIKLPNIAEAIAEIMGLLVLLRTESEVNLQTGIKGLIEAGAAKKAATIASELALANAEFLGYKLDKKQKNLASSFSPNKNKIDEFLKETNTRYGSYINRDDTDINDLFAPLLQLAARWNAQNFRRIPTGTSAATTQALLQILRQPDRTAQETAQQDDTEFREWRENVEDGYTADPMMPSDQLDSPYGRDRDERPQIRKLGEQ